MLPPKNEEDIKARINELKNIKKLAITLFDALIEIARKLELMPPYTYQEEVLKDIENRINQNRIDLSILRGD